MANCRGLMLDEMRLQGKRTEESQCTEQNKIHREVGGQRGICSARQEKATLHQLVSLTKSPAVGSWGRAQRHAIDPA